ncbi:hypothetical protein Poli38472_005857 [Pythium oligandrum]|uniref:N-acetyltransferase domain-containing protein n=1 Tax=Pythium oligandrum TaxID=41045 RepID=A0A8K1CSF2_PYTOL|nr:hypothetical protein Poli38472_005857 [Pythium oligandrum]|eukprot:TMW68389.1 hypothetical protein Poli38472_005857 [Pythium oligandrum]
MPLVVTRITTPEEFEIAKALRFQVFIQEQGFDPTKDVDEHDAAETTRHFIGKDTDLDEYVAVARVLPTPEERQVRIGRVAVLPKCRGKGHGLTLMLAVEDAMAHEADAFVLSVIYERKGFYQKCGYERLDDETYLEKGVPHCMMIKKRVSQA